MTDIAIKAESIGKRYRIGATKERYYTLRDSLMNLVKTPFRRFSGSPNRSEIWALKDVSFEIEHGEVVGIIGRNGAGKTTLLKILARITQPTEGYAEIRGRVGSLLEVGTGFHPELTGRENIYLSGAILGMRKAEIEKKFDEIVSFAEVEKFIDTPVKRFSSGMYVRLAFAVAAHLEPEILLVDEVLAVGDAVFQKKCLGKIGDVAKEGRTVLFVSHNMGAINRLCSRTLWLDEGRLQMTGITEPVVASYLSRGKKESGEILWDDQQSAPGDEHVRLRAVRIRNALKQVSSSLDIRLPFSVEIDYEVLRVLPRVRTGFRVITADGTVVFASSDTTDSAWEGRPRHQGIYRSRCTIPGNLLNEGQYGLTVASDIPHVELFFIEENVLSFHVEPTAGFGAQFSERWPGVICPTLPWFIEQLEKR